MNSEEVQARLSKCGGIPGRCLEYPGTACLFEGATSSRMVQVSTTSIFVSMLSRVGESRLRS